MVRPWASARLSVWPRAGRRGIRINRHWQPGRRRQSLAPLCGRNALRLLGNQQHVAGLQRRQARGGGTGCRDFVPQLFGGVVAFAGSIHASAIELSRTQRVTGGFHCGRPSARPRRARHPARRRSGAAWHAVRWLRDLSLAATNLWQHPRDGKTMAGDDDSLATLKFVTNSRQVRFCFRRLNLAHTGSISASQINRPRIRATIVNLGLIISGNIHRRLRRTSKPIRLEFFWPPKV